VKWGERLENLDAHRHDVLMQQEHQEPMDASNQFCPNLACSARGQTGAGTIRIHDRKRGRYRCRTCGQTFSARRGTMLEGLRKPTALIVIVVTLVAYGCPVQAIVHAFGLDERTVAAWRDRAGAHCQKVHEAIIEQGKLDLVHMQADEIRVKGRAMVMWMGLAMMVSTRLWVAGAVSQTRDRHLADRLLRQVRACAGTARALLVATDGWAAYPNSIQRAFREKIKETAGRGRACLRVWQELCIATVIKRTEKRHVVEVTRKMTRGTDEQAQELLKHSQGGSVLNTAFIERLNGTMRERLAILTRKCRHAARRLHAVETGMYLMGTTYNFCFPHHELSKGKQRGYPCTPAMAAGLTDHVWSIFEVLGFRAAPSPWVPPKPRGRPRTHPVADPSIPKRPRGRPRTKPLPDPSQPKRPPGRPCKLA
jgi:transposase-like protein/IS1 family transposase